jgi:hypothetical protein
MNRRESIVAGASGLAAAALTTGIPRLVAGEQSITLGKLKKEIEKLFALKVEAEEQLLKEPEFCALVQDIIAFRRCGKKLFTVEKTVTIKMECLVIPDLMNDGFLLDTGEVSCEDGILDFPLEDEIILANMPNVQVYTTQLEGKCKELHLKAEAFGKKHDITVENVMCLAYRAAAVEDEENDPQDQRI